MRYKEIYDEYNSLLSARSDYVRTAATLKENVLNQTKDGLQECNEIKKAINRVDEQLSRLEQAAGILDKALYHKLIILRRCAIMDSMPLNMRKKSLEFGNAMTALEDIPAGENTEKTLSLWVEGNIALEMDTCRCCQNIV